MQLALDLGCTPSELAQRISYAEFEELAAFYVWKAKQKK